MAESETFTIGAQARCTDGDCGEVRRVIVNPVAREVTHLVVEPKGRLGLARLVPLDLIDTSGDQVGSACHTGDRTCFDADVLDAHVA